MREFKATAPDAIANFREGVCCVHSVRPTSVTTSRGEGRFRQLGTLNVAACLLLASLVSVLGSDQPKVLSLEQAMKGLPLDFHIRFDDRLAFYQNKLYAGSGSGLLEITDGLINKVYQWDREDPGTGEVCHDVANGLLWVRTDFMKLAYYDGKTWRNVKFPKSKYPKKNHGHFLRGNRIFDIRFESGCDSFWLAGTGRAWFWKGPGAGKWTEPALPPDFYPEWYFGPLVRTMIPAEGMNYVVRRGVTNADSEMDSTGWYPIRLYGPEGDSVWSFANEQWNAITNKTGFFVSKQTAAVNKTAYIQTMAGILLEITEAGVAKVQIPGKCEAIVRSGLGTLLASFRGLGVFEFNGGWRQLLKSPHPEGDGKHDIGLAEQNGQVALVFCPRPQTDSYGVGYIHNAEGGLIYKSPHSLWVLRVPRMDGQGMG